MTLVQNWPRNPENSRLDGIFDAFAAGGSMSGSFSCGDRPVYVADSPGSTAQTESASGYGSPWRSAQCAGRRHDLAALQPGDHGLRRSHRLGGPFLRLVGVAVRLDDRGGDGELVFQRVMGRDKFPVLAARVVENEG